MALLIISQCMLRARLFLLSFDLFFSVLRFHSCFFCTAAFFWKLLVAFFCSVSPQYTAVLLYSIERPKKWTVLQSLASHVPRLKLEAASLRSFKRRYKAMSDHTNSFPKLQALLDGQLVYIWQKGGEWKEIAVYNSLTPAGHSVRRLIKLLLRFRWRT